MNRQNEKDVPESYEFVIVDEKAKEDISEFEKAEKTESELNLVITNQLRISQVFSVVISVLVFFILNYFSEVSQVLSVWILTGEIIWNRLAFISFLINLILLVGAMTLIMYFPKLTVETRKEIFYIIIAIIFSIAYTLTYKFFEIEIYLSNTRFELFYLVLFLILTIPILLINRINKNILYKISLFYSSFFVMIGIMDWQSSINLIGFIIERWTTILLLLLLFSLIIYYNYICSKIKRKVVKMKPIELKTSKKQ
jgi:hypothetical protein